MGNSSPSFTARNVFRHFVVLLGLVSIVSAATNGLLKGRRQRMHDVLRNVGSGGGSNLKAKPDAATRRPVTDVNGNLIPDYDVIYTFDQLIDHSNPRLGTFKQRYYHTWEYYRPGGPIVIMTPGEQAADGSEVHLTNRTMVGTIAQATNGAAIVLEHRFYGQSNPYPDMTVESLQVHTIEQAMDDLVYFAQKCQTCDACYAGALTSWTLNQRPGVFWAGYSSSGVIQPLLNFWQYFTPIQTHMPANCSADIQAAIEVIDSVLDSGDATTIEELQTMFGFSGLKPSDFANALTYVISDWQTLDVDSPRGSGFFEFCDALEVQGGQVAPASGFGARSALEAWGRFYRTSYIPTLCEGFDANTCVTFDGITSSDTRPSDDRSWWWTVCSEVGWAQVGPPAGVNGIVSKHFTSDSYTAYCRDAFQGAFSNSTAEYQARIDAASQKFLGWNTTAERLFVVNGNRDPWVEVTHSAAAARIASTATQPIFLTDGFHCSDMLISNAVDQSINQVFQSAITTFPQWVAEFKPSDKPATTTTTTGQNSNRNSSLGRRDAIASALGLALAGVVFTFIGL
ncbi:hypothetical protein EST38_g4379 [Candolleomyces aberdarensis]|uniref:Uncharacterized protein n=1 Tax=Candolleomyces aberdarensis TaxID=2316362 RepID=A0A4Q2DN99_9AGAR|nr:hypothetical protein EST38_g4379 [Candolleomyces aberdarensis]